MIRIAAPRALSAPKKRRSHRRSHGGGGGSLNKTLTSVALGAAVLAMVEKSNLTAQLPTMPVIGRKGTIAVAAYFLGGKKPGLARDVCLVATALAVTELVKDGKVSGDDD